MEQDNLKNYLDKIFSLSEDDEKNRQMYLKGLSDGTIQGPPTNYQFIDQNFLNQYKDETIMAEFPNMSMYQFLYENNKEHLQDTALIYQGKKITYKEMFEQIDLYANNLVNYGIKENDTVGLCTATTPETIYMFYAINKIGAVSNLIDLRKSEEEIQYCLNVRNTRLLFSLDLGLEKCLKVVENTNVDEVISFSPVDSLPKIVQILYKLKTKQKKNKKVSNLKKFLKQYSKKENNFTAEYKPDKPSFVVYTSGTTNLPKPVELTSDTANTKVFQYMNNGMIYSRGDVYLNVIPIFLAFGGIIGLHLPLCMGMQDVIVPAYDIDKTYDLVKQYNPQHLSLTPASYRALVNHEKFSLLDLCNVKTWGCGGDGFSSNEEKLVNKKLIQQGSTQKLSNGYGGSEIGAPFATQKENCTLEGSVGIPLPKNNIVIFKHGTREILPNNQIGDICMVGPHPMLRYIDMPEKTEETIIQIGNKKGIMLNDAGYTDENGNLFVKGRWGSEIVDKNGNIFWPIDIENVVIGIENVKLCAVVSNDCNDVKLFVTFDNEELSKKTVDEIKSVIEKYNLQDLNLDIEILESIPLSSNGKVDKLKLKNDFFKEENLRIIK